MFIGRLFIFQDKTYIFLLLLYTTESLDESVHEKYFRLFNFAVEISNFFTLILYYLYITIYNKFLEIKRP